MNNQYLKLPLFFDAGLLAVDLAKCEAAQWTAHYNQRDYSGEWTGIALRSASGKTGDIYAHIAENDSIGSDTAVLNQCTYFREVINSFHCNIQTVRLLCLAPGSEIREHRDMGLGYSFGSFRLHIPIETDQKVKFVVAGNNIKMEEGECWYADFNLLHSVSHQGTRRRVHLVLDGARNDWTDELFRTAGYDFNREVKNGEYDENTRSRIIENLQMMDTPVARDLIAALSNRPSGN